MYVSSFVYVNTCVYDMYAHAHMPVVCALLCGISFSACTYVCRCTYVLCMHVCSCVHACTCDFTISSSPTCVVDMHIQIA